MMNDEWKASAEGCGLPRRLVPPKPPATAEAPAKAGIANTDVVEITTYRTEHGFSNKRHPDKVSWGKTLEEDLSRRDFTINALALSFGHHGGVQIIDLYNGQKDINSKLIRAVAWMESGWRQDLASPTGAVGLMQVEPYTGEWVSQFLAHRALNLRTAEDNVTAGILLLGSGVLTTNRGAGA